MLIGNPDKFAFLLEIVPEWCSNGFVQGILNIYVNGVQYPDALRTTTLSTDVYWLLNDTSPFINPRINKELHTMETSELFNKLCNLAFPETEAIDNDCSYSVPLQELSDAGYALFIVASEKEVRLIIGQHSETNALTFADEVKMDILDFEYIKQELQNFYMNQIRQ